MEKKITEIPLAAQESEYTIPEGYTAEIVDGKVIVKKKEGEDERMIKAIKHILYENYTDAAVVEGVEIAEIVTWLEKQKEQKPISLNEPYNPDDYEVVMEGNVTDLRQKEQKPEEWSEEDEKRRKNVLRLITEADDKYIKEESRSPFCAEILWLKSLRGRPMISDNWKPSEEQMKNLEGAYKCELSAGLHTRAGILLTLYNDLKKLM